MRIESFTLKDELLKPLLQQYFYIGKNGDIAKITVEIVKLYFLSTDSKTQFKSGGKNEPDLTVTCKGVTKEYEIKGTEADNISFNNLKISSNYCFQKLIDGMEIIRVTNIRKNRVQLYFMKYNEDFIMVPEPRWSVKKIK